MAVLRSEEIVDDWNVVTGNSQGMEKRSVSIASRPVSIQIITRYAKGLI